MHQKEQTLIHVGSYLFSVKQITTTRLVEIINRVSYSTEQNIHYICGIKPNAMINERNVFIHTAEMAEHANPFATQEQKDAEIHRRELLLNALKPLMGL